MGSIISFLSNNYIWFLIISLILIFALIGYLVDTKQDDRFNKKIDLRKDFTRRIEAASAMNLSMNDALKDTKKIENNQEKQQQNEDGITTSHPDEDLMDDIKQKNPT